MEEELKVRIPKDNETLGIVETMLGAGRMQVRCQDNKLRVCRIIGKLRKRMWINVNDVVLVRPWEVQSDERGDIIYRYTSTEVLYLKKKGILKL